MSVMRLFIVELARMDIRTGTEVDIQNFQCQEAGTEVLQSRRVLVTVGPARGNLVLPHSCELLYRSVHLGPLLLASQSGIMSCNSWGSSAATCTSLSSS